MLKLRIHVLIFLACGSLLVGESRGQQTQPWPTEGWKTSTPKAEGLNAGPLNELHRKIESGTYGFVDKLLVIRNGRVVFDKSYDRDYAKLHADKAEPAGQYNYYDPQWHPFYRNTKLHSLQSVTKSVTALAIGIAIGRKEISGVDEKIVDIFADTKIRNNDRRKKKLTVAHLLTMRSGIEWNESLPYSDPNNSCIQLEASKDWFDFVIHRPLDTDPGTVFEYNSGASLLLSAIIKEKTGVFIDQYLEQHVFKPLGIEKHFWKKTPTGLPDTEGGLYLAAHDLAKIGYLCLNDGVWNGKQVLPKGWTANMLKPHVADIAPGNDANNTAYGYQWWLFRDRENADQLTYACLGFGGQYLLVSPKHKLIAVANGWNIFGRRQLPASVLLATILRAVENDK